MFAAAQAAQKCPPIEVGELFAFAAAQAAQKFPQRINWRIVKFAAAQAAQKNTRDAKRCDT